MTIILIDASYFIFYRYYATIVWWKHNAEPPYENLHTNEVFVKKFIELFKAKLREIPNKLKIKDPYQIYVAYDCPRGQIWRNEKIDNYKGTRKCADDVGEFFKIVMNERLFDAPIITGTLSLDCLEADDIIALFIKKIHQLHPEREIYVITNDHDYLQLKTDQVFLINLKYQRVGHSKTTGDAQKDLFIKAVCGDKSDNINKIFKNKKVGPKTAEKLYDDEDAFKKICADDSDETYNNYLTNMTLIAFVNIPEKYSQLFYEKYTDMFFATN